MATQFVTDLATIIPHRQTRRWFKLALGISLMMAVGVAGCDRRAQTPAPPAAETPAAPPPEPAPPVEPPPTTSPPASPPAPTPEASPEPTAQAPTSPAAPLPDALVKQWEPLSNVLLIFGPMTVTSGEISWGSGQTSPYTLVATEDGFLLRLEATPSFYDTPNPYLKLIPQTDASGAITTVDVAFYEDEAQAQQDEYIMYGSYFLN